MCSKLPQTIGLYQLYFVLGSANTLEASVILVPEVPRKARSADPLGTPFP
jgi:hypothetical protein